MSVMSMLVSGAGWIPYVSVGRDCAIFYFSILSCVKFLHLSDDSGNTLVFSQALSKHTSCSIVH